MTEKPLTEAEERVLAKAVFMFRAFVSGVKASDVKRRTITQADADDWGNHAIETFEGGIRDLLK